MIKRSGSASSRVSASRLKEALALREALEKRRPKFVRPESWRYKKLKVSWRRPKGIDHKVRLQVKGWPKKVKVGYRGPRLARGLHPSGLEDVLISSVKEMEGLDPQRAAVRIAASVGSRKRKLLVDLAGSRGLRVLNARGLRKR